MNTQYNNGTTQWKHGQVFDWIWNGYQRVNNRWNLGPCPRCGSPTSNYGGGFNCHGTGCPNSAEVFACSTADPEPAWWNTGINVIKDGNMWCAYKIEGFTNIQECPAGFGETPNEAVENLGLEITL